MWQVGLFAAVAAGCVAIKKGNGELATEPRTVPAFTEAKVENGAHLVLVAGAEASGGEVDLEVQGDSNLLRHVLTTVEEGRLRVTVERQISTANVLGASAQVGSLTWAGASIAARIEVSDVDEDALTLDAADRGEVVASGEVEALTVAAEGTATVDASELTAGSAEITLTGGAAAELCVEGAVTGSVAGGASLIVTCGGSVDGVETSEDGTVSTR